MVVCSFFFFFSLVVVVVLSEEASRLAWRSGVTWRFRWYWLLWPTFLSPSPYLSFASTFPHACTVDKKAKSRLSTRWCWRIAPGWFDLPNLCRFVDHFDDYHFVVVFLRDTVISCLWAWISEWPYYYRSGCNSTHLRAVLDWRWALTECHRRRIVRREVCSATVPLSHDPSSSLRLSRLVHATLIQMSA